MKTKQIRNSLLLLVTAFIWGSAFVAQSVGMDYVEPFTFTAVRSVIGGLVLIPCIFLLRKLKAREEGTISDEPRPVVTKIELIGGICCGTALFAASNAQQVGIVYTTVGKGGFITALYVVIVPIMGLFLKKKVPKIIWFCVALSVVGLYMLCMTGEEFVLAYGDLLILICAVLFSIHIMIIDYFSPKGDGVVISCIQFFTCGILSAVVMLLTESPGTANILAAWLPILYAGVLSSGVAYTLQVVAQKDVNPTVASLILCLESVVSALTGWVILHETLTTQELLGCGLMFVAIVLAQVPMPERKKV
ncbi:MAG: DMT family transporter [Tyzzerella sp.]|nr:DMT family transporter [Tyzzerella sp.]